MRLLKLLNTNDLKIDIQKKIHLLNINVNINFDNDTQSGYEGTYVFSDKQGYHYVETERGNEIVHKVTDDVFEINYWVLEPIVSRIAFDFEAKNRLASEDSRKIVFKKKLELFSSIGKNYKKREEIEQDEILEMFPFKK